jgi:hypothetical protein
MTMHPSSPGPHENAAKIARTRAMIDHTDSRVRTTLEWMVEATAAQQPSTIEKVTVIAELPNDSKVAIAEAHGELARAEDARGCDQAEFEAHLAAAAGRTNDAWVLSDLAADKLDQLRYPASKAAASA